jgi:hypothetical protein
MAGLALGYEVEETVEEIHEGAEFLGEFSLPNFQGLYTSLLQIRGVGIGNLHLHLLGEGFMETIQETDVEFIAIVGSEGGEFIKACSTNTVAKFLQEIGRTYALSSATGS